MRLFTPIILLMLVEIALFITLGGWMGLALSLLVIFGTALLGVGILRATGQRAAGDLRAAMAGIGQPEVAAGNHALRMFAGLLLILPGFLGDLLGLLLLLPQVRALIRRAVLRRVQVHRGFGVQPGPNVVIDAEFIELDPNEPQQPPRGPSGWTRH